MKIFLSDGVHNALSTIQTDEKNVFSVNKMTESKKNTISLYVKSIHKII